MLKIKLTRTGKRSAPHYRIIVAEAKSKRDGSYLENLGHYIPYTNPATLKLNTKSFDRWLSQGAQPTPVVSRLRSLAKDNQLVSIPKKASKKNPPKATQKTAK